MQSLGSAISYARRYGLSAILGVSQKDDDGNAATQPEKKTPMNSPSIQKSSDHGPSKLSTTEAPGDHVITVGKKYAGMKIRQLTPVEWATYATWLEDDANKTGKSLSKNALDFIACGNAHFNNPNKPTDIPF